METVSPVCRSRKDQNMSHKPELETQAGNGEGPSVEPPMERSHIEVEITGPEDFHCFRIILHARPDPQGGERQPIEIMLHARSLIELIHKCSLALSDWQAETSALLMKRLTGGESQ
jgi:hypothetical protein